MRIERSTWSATTSAAVPWKPRLAVDRGDRQLVRGRVHRRLVRAPRFPSNHASLFGCARVAVAEPREGVVHGVRQLSAERVSTRPGRHGHSLPPAPVGRYAARVTDVTDEEQEAVSVLAATTMSFLKDRMWPTGTFSDVYCWIDRSPRHSWTRLTVAIVGDPSIVSNIFGMNTPDFESRVNGRTVAAALNRIQPGAGDEWAYERSLVLGDFLDRYGGMTLGSLVRSPFTEFSCTFMPDGGIPWTDEDTSIEYWTQKGRRWQRSTRPHGLVRVDDTTENKQVLGIDPCTVFRPSPSSAELRRKICDAIGTPHPIRCRLTERGPVWMATHSLGKRSLVDNTADAVRACGGLLFPSLAVGPIPASNFGPVCLVGNLSLVLQGLPPYEQGAWVYDTDAWTITSGEANRWVARQLFRELCGHQDWTYGHNMWVLGPPKYHTGGPRGDQAPVTSFAQLAASIGRRAKVWRRSLTEREFDKLGRSLSGSDEGYSYCETKAREVVPLSEFPYLIAPVAYQGEVMRFVERTGYSGTVVFGDEDRWLYEEMAQRNDEYALYRWAWEVAEIAKDIQPRPVPLPRTFR